MSTQAFGSRRVTQSLKAIAKYLDDGARIAGGVPPGQVVRLDLEDAPSTVSPRLRSVLWVISDTETSSSIPVGDVEDGATVVVSGVNLPEPGSENPVTVFKLVGPGTGTRYFQATAADISLQSATGFKAALHLVPTSPETPPPLGSYDALVINAAGQTFLLADACSIEASTYDGSVRISDKGSAGGGSQSRARRS
jgi:hypothetical protein